MRPLHPFNSLALSIAGIIILQPAAQSSATELFSSAITGRTGELNAAIGDGAEVNKQDESGATPLHYAAMVNDPAALRMLLESGARTDLRDADGRTALECALLLGHEAAALELLRSAKIDLSHPAESSRSPLMLATQQGMFETIQQLVSCGASPDATDAAGNSSLHLAAARGNAQIVEYLLQHINSHDALNRAGHTPLHLALICGQLDAARVLLEAGADLSRPTKTGNLPMHLAAVQGSPALIKMLAQKGAAIEELNARGDTPLLLALRCGRSSAVAALVELGAVLFPQDSQSWYRALQALERDSGDALAQLPLKGLHEIVSMHDASGNVLLHFAAREGDDHLIRFLLTAGADPAAKNQDGITPLHLSLSSADVPAAFHLLRAGADPNAGNQQGQTPLQLAPPKAVLGLWEMAYREGLGAVLRGDISEGRHCLIAAMRLTPQDRLHCDAAAAFIRTFEGGKANIDDEMMQWTRDKKLPDYVADRLHLSLAEFYLRKGNPALAEQAITPINVKQSAVGAAARVAQAFCHYSHGKIADAKAQLAMAGAVAPNFRKRTDYLLAGNLEAVAKSPDPFLLLDQLDAPGN